MSFITYIVLDPRKPFKVTTTICDFDFEPVYVGKGTHERADNVLRTLTTVNAKKHAGIMFHRWLLGMKSLGYDSVPIIRIEQPTEKSAFLTEELLIDQLGLKSEGGILYNARRGGDGGWALSNETKKLLAEANRGDKNPNWGKSWSEERRAKWKQTWESKERKRSPESMKNAWNAMRRQYEIVDPSGHVYTTDNLTAFCLEKNIPLTPLRTALKGDGVVKTKRRKSILDEWRIRYIT